MIQCPENGIKWSPICHTFPGGEAARAIGYMSYVSEDFSAEGRKMLKLKYFSRRRREIFRKIANDTDDT